MAERYLFAVVFSLIAAFCPAQNGKSTVLHLQLDQPLTGVTTKKVLSVLQSQDPSAKLSAGQGSAIAKVAMHAPLDAPAVIAAFASAGIVAVEGAPGVPAQRTADPAYASFPVLKNTGNPVQDELDFAVAKAAWLAAHPGAVAPATDNFDPH